MRAQPQSASFSISSTIIDPSAVGCGCDSRLDDLSLAATKSTGFVALTQDLNRYGTLRFLEIPASSKLNPRGLDGEIHHGGPLGGPESLGGLLADLVCGFHGGPRCWNSLPLLCYHRLTDCTDCTDCTGTLPGYFADQPPNCGLFLCRVHLNTFLMSGSFG